MGLYSGLFHPLRRANSWNDGLVSALLHGTPGYEISVALGLMESHTIVENAGSVICYFKVNASVSSMDPNIGWETRCDNKNILPVSAS